MNVKTITATLLIAIFVMSAMAVMTPTASASAPPPAVRKFTSTIAPTTALTSETDDYTVTVTNYGTSTDELGSATITIPSFTGVSVSGDPTASHGRDWTASIASGKIKLQAHDDHDRLDENDYVSVTFSATAPVTADVYTWTTSAWHGKNWSGDVFTIVGDQPAVTVSSPPPTQYLLTIGTNFGTIDPNSGWYDDGSTVTITATAPSVGDGERYVWNGWTGSGDISYTGTDNPATSAVTVNSAVSETASWTHQYYLTVTSTHDTPGGEGWYDDGATAYATLTDAIVTEGGKLYAFTSWSIDASGTDLTSNGIVMDGAKTAVAEWAQPGISLEKTANVTETYVGKPIGYTYMVTNTGDTPLSSVGVTDDKIGTATYKNGDTDMNGLLDLTETWTFTASYTILGSDDGSVLNTATVSGMNGRGEVVTATDSCVVIILPTPPPPPSTSPGADRSPEQDATISYAADILAGAGEDYNGDGVVDIADAFQALVDIGILTPPSHPLDPTLAARLLAQLSEPSMYGADLWRYPSVEGRVWLLYVLEYLPAHP